MEQRWRRPEILCLGTSKYADSSGPAAARQLRLWATNPAGSMVVCLL